MTDIREYMRKKKQRENTVSADSKEYNDKLKHHHKMVIIRIAILAVVVLAGIGAGYLYFQNKVYSKYEVLAEAEKKDSETSYYKSYNGKILKVSCDGVSCISAKNEMIWNQTYEMQHPISDICGTYVAVAEENGNKILIMNTDGMQGEIETLLPIKKVQVASQGVVAVLLDDGTVSKIHYYDKLGNLLAENKAPIEKSGYPLDITISDDGLKMGVSYLQVENESVVSVIAFYNFDSVGSNEIDHLVSSQKYEGIIIPTLQFVDNNTAVFYGDSKFGIYQGSQKPVSVFESNVKDEIQSVFYNSQYIGMVLKNQEGELPNRIEVYNLKGGQILKKDFNFSYDEIEISNKQILMYNENECCIMNLRGVEKFRYEFKESVLNILPVSKNKYILISGNKIQEIKLK